MRAIVLALVLAGCGGLLPEVNSAQEAAELLNEMQRNVREVQLIMAPACSMLYDADENARAYCDLYDRHHTMAVEALKEAREAVKDAAMAEALTTEARRQVDEAAALVAAFEAVAGRMGERVIGD